MAKMFYGGLQWGGGLDFQFQFERFPLVRTGVGEWLS